MAQLNTPPTGEKAANPVTMAIYVAIGAIVMVIGIILLASYAVHSHKVGANVAVTEKTTLSNIAPLNTVVVDATKGPLPSLGLPKPAAVVDAPVVAMAIPTTLPPGTVVAKPAGGKGAATLYDHAIKGIGVMPAKGGNSALADADVKAAVDYMMAMNK